MALNAATVWEIRTTGNDNNGAGFYNRNPGTSVDYGQQNTPQLALTDLAQVLSSTTLTSAAGGFTAAMVGNLIHIVSGTNFAVGWYEITARASSNSVTIDRTATSGGAGSVGVGNVGGATATIDSIDNVVIAGNTIWVKVGIYNLVSNIVITDGSTFAPICITGYNVTRGDTPRGDYRPLVICGLNGFVSGILNELSNFRFTTSHANGIRLTTYAAAKNIKVNATSNGVNTAAITGTTHTAVIDCEVSNSGTSWGIWLSSGGNKIMYCYVHNCAGAGGDVTLGRGIYVTGSENYVIYNIITNCYSGISQQNDGYRLNNIIYSCTYGVYFTGAGTGQHDSIFLNNVIENNTTGVYTVTANAQAYFDYNNFHGNGTDVTNVTKGLHDTAYDPMFCDAANGDFRLKLASPLRTIGFSSRLGVG